MTPTGQGYVVTETNRQQIIEQTTAALAPVTAFRGRDVVLVDEFGVNYVWSGTAYTSETSGPGGAAGDSTYSMPPPTGVVATDQANLVAAFASSKKTIVFSNEGTYLTNAQITWPSNKYLLSTCAYGTVIIQASASATMNWMFSGASSVTNYGAENITFDANRSARFAATGQTNCGTLEWTTGTPTTSHWERCIFKNLRGNAFTVTGASHEFEQCTFGPGYDKVLTLLGGTKSTWDHCLFYDYNTGLTGSPAIGMQEWDNLAARGLKITNSHFVPLTSNWTSIEAVSTAIGRYPQIDVISNTFWGVATQDAGIGMSGPFGYTNIALNKFLTSRNGSQWYY